ncbi:MAG: GntR family transcriptional regulator, partial [Mesorhizobium sp.]
MDDPGNGGHAALVQLQAYLAQMDHAGETRLPAERELSE